ncbi:MAG TPA: PilZ domain-containing protein [Burkholderiales bacterium]|nr:PilZ domain-containing protein [Burkholderiales bacterium]
MSKNRNHIQRSRRFQVSRRGVLSHEDHRFACLIQDISERGMFLICNYDLEIGLELAVQFELEPGADFSGRIKVRHFNEGCFGAEVVAADQDSDRNWRSFLESRYAGQLQLAERRIGR